MERQFRIPIYMYHLLTPEINEAILTVNDSDPFQGFKHKYTYFGPSGRWLLGLILKSLNLTRKDGIAIITTSNETYVSTCVSVTAFNHASISREVISNTKVVILIHEFGYVIPDLITQITSWRNQGLIVIENCAHIVGEEIDGQSVGSFGDFALFSLSKVIPARSGGMLKTSYKINLPILNDEQTSLTAHGRSCSELYFPKFKFFNENRHKRAEIIIEQTKEPNTIFIPSFISVPYFVGIVTSQKAQIQERVSWVEWGATLKNDLLYFPTNPLVDLKVFKFFIREIFSE